MPPEPRVCYSRNVRETSSKRVRNMINFLFSLSSCTFYFSLPFYFIAFFYFFLVFVSLSVSVFISSFIYISVSCTSTFDSETMFDLIKRIKEIGKRSCHKEGALSSKLFFQNRVHELPDLCSSLNVTDQFHTDTKQRALL
jgi:hypothetical protein